MLNARQTLFYNYTVSIYRQADPSTNAVYGATTPVIGDLGASYSLLASGVKAMFWSSPDSAIPTVVGRTSLDNIFTLDRWKFEASVDIKDTDAILCTVSPNGNTLAGRVWMVQGNTQDHNTLSLSNTQAIYAKLAEAPPGVS